MNATEGLGLGGRSSDEIRSLLMQRLKNKGVDSPSAGGQARDPSGQPQDQKQHAQFNASGPGRKFRKKDNHSYLHIKGRPQAVQAAKEAVKDLLRLGLTYSEIQRQTDAHPVFLTSIFQRLGLEPNRNGDNSVVNSPAPPSKNINMDIRATALSCHEGVVGITQGLPWTPSSPWEKNLNLSKRVPHRYRFGTDRWSHQIDMDIGDSSDDELFHKPLYSQCSSRPLSYSSTPVPGFSETPNSLESKLSEIKRLNEKLKELEARKKEANIREKSAPETGKAAQQPQVGHFVPEEVNTSPQAIPTAQKTCVEVGLSPGGDYSESEARQISSIEAEIHELENEAIYVADENYNELVDRQRHLQNEELRLESLATGTRDELYCVDIRVRKLRADLEKELLNQSELLTSKRLYDTQHTAVQNELKEVTAKLQSLPKRKDIIAMAVTNSTAEDAQSQTAIGVVDSERDRAPPTRQNQQLS